MDWKMQTTLKVQVKQVAVRGQWAVLKQGMEERNLGALKWGQVEQETIIIIDPAFMRLVMFAYDQKYLFLLGFFAQQFAMFCMEVWLGFRNPLSRHFTNFVPNSCITTNDACSCIEL